MSAIFSHLSDCGADIQPRFYTHQLNADVL